MQNFFHLGEQSDLQLESDCSKEEQRIRQLIRDHNFDKVFSEVRLCVQQKFVSIQEASAIRNELLVAKALNSELEAQVQKLTHKLNIVEAKYLKTKLQKQDLLRFYRKEKSNQHASKMIDESKEYLAVLTQ